MTHSSIQTGAVPSSHPGALAAAALCAALGLVLLYGAGFAQPQALHEAAHDARHAFAFPCH